MFSLLYWCHLSLTVASLNILFNDFGNMRLNFMNLIDTWEICLKGIKKYKYFNIIFKDYMVILILLWFYLENKNWKSKHCKQIIIVKCSPKWANMLNDILSMNNIFSIFILNMYIFSLDDTFSIFSLDNTFSLFSLDNIFGIFILNNISSIYSVFR